MTPRITVLLVQRIGEADVRPEGAVIPVGKRAGTLPSGTAACKDDRAEDAARARIWGRRREVAPAVVEPGRRQVRLPAKTEIQNQFAVDVPVVLHKPGKVGKLLADETRRVDLTGIDVPEQGRLAKALPP